MNLLKIRFKGLKSQSALEFLTTYGWAFLILLVMIAALAYFGILNPSKVLPNSCTVGSEFQCLDYVLQSGAPSTFRLKLKANEGTIINITSVNLTSDTATTFSCSSPVGSDDVGAFINSSTPFDIFWTNCNTAVAGFNSGNKAKILIKIRYFEVASGPTYAREVNGEVFTTVI